MDKGKLKIISIVLLSLYIAAIVGVFYLNGINLSLLIVVIFFVYYLKGVRKKTEPNYLSLSFLFVFTLASLLVGKNITSSLGLGPYPSALLALVILINVLFSDLEFSFAYLFFVCILNSTIFDYDFRMFLVCLVAGATSIYLSTHVRKRIDIIKAGVFAGLMQVVMIACLVSFSELADTLKTFTFSMQNPLTASLLVNGLFSPIVVLGSLSLFEFIFGVVTNISLLELSDFNHPLLRRMILEAPGTYQHSLVVANLAEAAAEAIGSNSLLARVGSYYHDIGKISKAEYFSENQMLAGVKDKHKKLSPAMSKLIIINQRLQSSHGILDSIYRIGHYIPAA